MINDLELEEISSQLSRAEVNKNKLIKNIYKEYESYLKLVRELIFTSVEKTIYRFISDFSRNDKTINTKELSKHLKHKITYLINSQLPLITIEQLKINDSITKENLEIDSNFLKEIAELKDNQEEYEYIHNRDYEIAELKDNQKVQLNFQDSLIAEESVQFSINKDISNSNQYYRSINNEKFSSIDLDCREDLNDFQNLNSIKRIDLEEHIMNSLLEISKEAIDNKFKDSQDLNKPFKKRRFSELLSEKLCFDFNNISEKQLQVLCKEKGIEVNPNTNIGQMLDALMGELIEPTLIEPTFVIDYPKVISPLAKCIETEIPI